MIAYYNFLNQKNVLSEFVEGFLSEVFPLGRDERRKWRVYEKHKRILGTICSSPSEYEFAIESMTRKLEI